MLPARMNNNNRSLRGCDDHKCLSSFIHPGTYPCYNIATRSYSTVAFLFLGSTTSTTPAQSWAIAPVLAQTSARSKAVCRHGTAGLQAPAPYHVHAVHGRTANRAFE